MALIQEENVLGKIGGSVEEHVGTERNDFVDFSGSRSDKGSGDMADLLPSDPFGTEDNTELPSDPFAMDFDIAVVMAITDWIEDLGLTCEYETDESSKDGEVDGENDEYTEDEVVDGENDESSEDEEVDNENYESSKDEEVDDDKIYATELKFVYASMEVEHENVEIEAVDPNAELESENESFNSFNMLEGSQKEDVKDYDNGDKGVPADSMYFALGYLGVRDLLSVEIACKSFRDAVRNDPLLWRNIDIECPLSDKITDDNLLQLTNKAQGTLRSLSLVQCLEITNYGLKQVLERNLGLTKLSVPGCIRLGIEDIFYDLKVFNSIGTPGIKHLRIGELRGATSQLYEEFKLLLGADDENKSGHEKPRFCRVGQVYLSLNDERPLDIETCPRCEQVRQVYDCPAETCQVKPPSVQKCRACSLCIARCFNCGCCLINTDYEETFCLDPFCLKCFAAPTLKSPGLLSSKDEVPLYLL